jgi:cell division protein FtsB
MFHHLIARYRHYATIQNGTIVLAAIIALGWVWGTVQTLQKNFSYQQQVDALNQQVELEKLRNENLKFQQVYFKSDEFLELSARQRLGKANPGEKLIILPDSRSITDKTASQRVAPTVPKASNLSQWLQFFFGDKADT